MDNFVYDILINRLEEEIKETMDKIGIKIKELSIDGDPDPKIKIILTSELLPEEVV